MRYDIKSLHNLYLRNYVLRQIYNFKVECDNELDCNNNGEC